MSAFRCLTAAMDVTPLPGSAPRWSDIMLELLPAISSPLTPETERLLVGVLRFGGHLRLTVSSDMPHSMPPENMLKSLAVQALARWTGLDHLQDMLKVQMTTASPSLASLIRDVIGKTRDDMAAARSAAKEEDAEQVAESSPREARKTVRRPLAKERDMSYLPGFRRRAYRWDRDPALAG